MAVTAVRWRANVPANRVTIIPRIHGKLTRDRKMSEPDIHWILDKWLDRHPEFRGREKDIRIWSGRWTLPEGNRTEVITVSIPACDEIAGYDPAQDADLYEYFLADDASA
jgi:hypothetical protein